jgi:hypothetical protein
MAHMLCSGNPISHLSLEISPVWFPLIRKELKCDLTQVFCSSYVMCFCVFDFTSTNSVCWLFYILLFLFLLNLSYILLSVILTCGHILNFLYIYIYLRSWKFFCVFACLEFIVKIICTPTQLFLVHKVIIQATCFA